jgi:hypothetical protein
VGVRFLTFRVQFAQNPQIEDRIHGLLTIELFADFMMGQQKDKVNDRHFSQCRFALPVVERRSAAGVARLNS